MRPELVIFDFDGTLVDTAPDLIRATNFFLESQGFDSLPPEVIRSEIGMGLKRLILTIYPDQPVDEATARQIEGGFLEIYDREFLHSPALFPGAYEFLTEWDGQIAVVSNKRARYILPIMEKLGLNRLTWAAVIGGDTYSHMKPHPEPFLGAMNAAGVAPDSTVIVGDGQPDVTGALAMGSKCICAGFGYTPLDQLMALGGWASIDEFSELLPLLRTLR
jgi:phosphoglycolate phosphatase